MGLGAVLDTVLSFVGVMLVLSLSVQALMELIKRFFATKAKTMEALLAAMGENAIQSALVAMKTPPKPDATTRQAANAEQNAIKAQQAVIVAATASLQAFSAAQQAKTEENAQAADAAEQVYIDATKVALTAQQTASDAWTNAGIEKSSMLLTLFANIVNTVKSKIPGATPAADRSDSKASVLAPWTRGRSNLTPEALRAELVRNAIAVSQAITANFSRRADRWENAFEAAAVLANDKQAFLQRVGPACVLTKDDLTVLDQLTVMDLQILLEYVGNLVPAPIELTLLLNRFSTAAVSNDFQTGLPSFNQSKDPNIKNALSLALKRLGALPPTQAQSLFAEYVLPVRDEVEKMLGTADTAAEKFGKMLPRDVRERLYDVGRDVKQAQQAVEDWYSSWIIQFSALYEAKLKVWAFWVGLLVVVCLNANALNIYQAISRSSTLRTTLSQGPQVPQITSSLQTIAKKTDELKLADIQKYQANIDQIYQLNVVGWHIADFPTTFNAMPHWIEGRLAWVYQNPSIMLSRILGWLLTAALIGLGAPFWNDLFDTLVAIKGKKSTPPDGGAHPKQNPK